MSGQQPLRNTLPAAAATAGPRFELTRGGVPRLEELGCCHQLTIMPKSGRGWHTLATVPVCQWHSGTVSASM
jgi:hypothetical protein